MLNPFQKLQLRAARAAAGLCQCGRAPRPGGYKTCQTCADRVAAAVERKRAAGFRQVWARVATKRSKP